MNTSRSFCTQCARSIYIPNLARINYGGDDENWLDAASVEQILQRIELADTAERFTVKHIGHYICLKRKPTKHWQRESLDSGDTNIL